ISGGFVFSSNTLGNGVAGGVLCNGAWEAATATGTVSCDAIALSISRSGGPTITFTSSGLHACGPASTPDVGVDDLKSWFANNCYVNTDQFQVQNAAPVDPCAGYVAIALVELFSGEARQKCTQ